MKKLMLVAALAATACGADDVAIDAGPRPTTTDAPTTTSQPPATVEGTTTTTGPETEPASVTTVPYVAPSPRRTTTTVYEPPSPQGRTTRGDTPPEYVKQCESGGDYRAVNPNGHYGAWQFSQSTWESVGGTGRPDYATPAEQDYRASLLWAGGAGASHWECA